MFGTNDVVYVPEGECLLLDDVQRWQRIRMDTRRYGLRIRPAAFEEVVVRMRAAMDLCRASSRFSGDVARLSSATDAMIADLAATTGSANGEQMGSLADTARCEGAIWWIRLSDMAPESFHPEDYERDARGTASSTPHLVFGAANITALDGLEIDMPGDQEEGLPFAVDTPAEDGLVREELPPLEPLALVHEFCGAHGSSAHGHTVNITSEGRVATAHQFCTPIGRVGGGLLATLYTYYPTPSGPEVVARLSRPELIRTAKLLEGSQFQAVSEGPTWRIYRNSGDIVHLYDGLEGKESEGAANLPALMIVAAAGGQRDQEIRAELLRAIRETV